MKKKILTSLFVLIATVSYAQTYNFLIFQNNDGTTQSIEVSNLTITFSDGKLQAANSVTSQVIDLTNLSKMYFSETEISGIDTVQIDGSDIPVDVFSTDGASQGNFSSLKAALQSLRSGVYVVKMGDKNFKISVK